MAPTPYWTFHHETLPGQKSPLVLAGAWGASFAPGELTRRSPAPTQQRRPRDQKCWGVTPSGGVSTAPYDALSDVPAQIEARHCCAAMLFAVLADEFVGSFTRADGGSDVRLCQQGRSWRNDGECEEQQVKGEAAVL